MLHTGLLMGARGLRPLAPPEHLHSGDGAIARTRARSPSRHLRGPYRRHHHPRVTGARGLIERARVVRRIPCDAGDVAGHPDQLDAHGCIIDRRLRQRMRDDHARAVDTQRELLAASHRVPRAPCVAAAHSPAPTRDSPVRSTMRCTNPLAGTAFVATSSR